MKFKSIKSWNTSDWGTMVLSGIVSNYLAKADIGFFLKTIFSVFALLSFASAFVWVYRKIKKLP